VEGARPPLGAHPQAYGLPRAVPRRRGGGRARALAAGLLFLLGIASLAAGTLALGAGAAMAREQVGHNGLEAASDGFAFAKQAWRAMPVDHVFPPTITTRDASPVGRAERVFTRIGVAPPATCAAAFAPGLTGLLAGRGCGPVLRADYTDATESLVTTVGVAVLDTTPSQQRRLRADMLDSPQAVEPRLLAFPGTAAEAVAGRQPLARQVSMTAQLPFLVFAVTTFSDGRQAGDDPGTEAPVQSGAKFMAANLIDLVDANVAQGMANLRSRGGS
jgi:hypothetical protein